MARVRPNRIAIRDGVGARLIELGFRRKSERLYEKDEGDLYFWVRFVISDDDSFVDRAGVVSREMERMVAATGEELHQYGVTEPAPGHISISAYDYWAGQDALAEAEFRNSRWWLNLLGPCKSLVPWDRMWAKRSAFKSSRFAGGGRWRVSGSPSGCAAVSLEKWRESVEPWLDEVRDPDGFARCFMYGLMAGEYGVLRAIAWARAGDMNKAKALLLRVHDRRRWTHADAIEKFRKGPRSAWFFKTEAEQTKAAENSVKMALAESAQAERVAAHLGISLRGP